MLGTARTPCRRQDEQCQKEHSEFSILDSNGAAVVEYEYGAWGSPFRDRSCVCSEAGLYSLGSRYCSPAIGRFLNADEIESLGMDGGEPARQYHPF